MSILHGEQIGHFFFLYGENLKYKVKLFILSASFFMSFLFREKIDFPFSVFKSFWLGYFFFRCSKCVRAKRRHGRLSIVGQLCCSRCTYKVFSSTSDSAATTYRVDWGMDGGNAGILNKCAKHGVGLLTRYQVTKTVTPLLAFLFKWLGYCLEHQAQQKMTLLSKIMVSFTSIKQNYFPFSHLNLFENKSLCLLSSIVLFFFLFF